MRTTIKLAKIINIIALLFSLLGGFGLAITGALQVLAAFIYLLTFPKNKLIYIYYTLVIIFFIFWDRSFGWLFSIPIFLIIFLTYIIHFQNRKKMSFLNAQWKNLALINYEINPQILKNYIPKGTEIDLYNGKCYISLVGFMFKEVKILGFKIPFHINFEEVNLRFYVKRFENNEWKRGVVFIKEIVPKHALTFVANAVYKEHYQTLLMKHSITQNKETIDFVYQWKTENKWNTILIETEKNPIEIELNSEAEFITEHYFGYTKVNENKTFEYEVKHPRWQQLKITNHQIDVDFKKTYGSEFEFLENQKPASIQLAIGSVISVENKKTIKL